MFRRLWSWLHYRAEKRMLERNPYDYIRFVLGMPDATDEELDEAAERMAAAMREVGISAHEMARMAQAFSEAIGSVDWDDVRSYEASATPNV